jgi:hypothetical protein
LKNSAEKPKMALYDFNKLTILACGDSMIADLHYIVQIAMGWKAKEWINLNDFPEPLPRAPISR